MARSPRPADDCTAAQAREARAAPAIPIMPPPEEAADELDLPAHVEDVNWEEEEEELDVDELGEKGWNDLDEDEDEDEEEADEDDRWE